MSVLLGFVPVLVLLSSIAIAYKPQIGRALESTPLLARSTPLLASAAEPAVALGPTAEKHTAHDAAPNESAPATTAPSPSPTVTTGATFTSTPLPTPTLEPSPTPAPATATPRPTATPIPVPTGAPPTRLVIPSIRLDSAVLPVGPVTVYRGGTKMLIWDTLRDVPSFHETAAYPGTGGNIVINGHRDIYGSVFLYLNQVRRGDQITLYVDDLPYLYEVVDIIKLPYVNATPKQMADHLRLIAPTREERLTLLTCTPVGTATHRLYVIAKPPSAGRDDLILR